MIRTTVFKVIGASAIAVAAITAGATPSFASPVPAGGSSQSTTVLQGPGGGASQHARVIQPANPACMTTPPPSGPACKNRTSETTRNAINSWNFGGAELGSAAANLISSAVFGLPSLAIDILQNLLHF
jgi:hypothetical protein